MENITRRSFGKNLGLGALTARFALLTGTGTLAVLSGGCNPTTWIDEADNIIMLIAPLGDGAASIVELIDPAIASAVQAADVLYDAAVKAVEQYLTAWAAAAAAAQPAILTQLQAALATLKTQATNLIGLFTLNGGVLSQLGGIASAILGEIEALVTVIPQIQAAGGTTAALAAVSTKMVNRPHRYAHQYRDDVVKALSIKTGNVALDQKRLDIVANLKDLKFKG